MRSKISGIVRLLVTAIAAYSFAIAFIGDYSYSKLSVMKWDKLITPFMIFQICACYITYMAMNGVMEVLGKRLRGRAMYIVNTLVVLSLGAYIIGMHNISFEPAKFWFNLFYLFMFYFTIADFIFLFIGRNPK